MRVSASSSVFVESFLSVFRRMSASSLCGDDEGARRVEKPALRRPSIRSIVMISFASRRTSPVFSSDDVLGRHLAQSVRLLLGARAADLLLLGLVEELEDLAVGDVAERLQEHRDRQLPLAVDVDVHDVVHVEAELHPRSRGRR